MNPTSISRRATVSALAALSIASLLATLGQTGAAQTHTAQAMIAQTKTAQTMAATSGTLEINGAKIFYTSQGSGEPMLLIHGYPLSGELFKDNRAALSRRFRVVTMDLRGFGKSAAPDSKGSIALYAQDALALMDTLKIQKAVVGGMSMGGMVSFEIYRRAPERVAGLVLISTSHLPPGGVSEVATWRATGQQAKEAGQASLVPSLLPRMLTGATRTRKPELGSFLGDLMKQSSVYGWLGGGEALATRPDSTPTLATVKVPTLIVVGLEDNLLPVEVSKMINAGIAGSTLTVIPGAGHAAILEAAPIANRAILAWANKSLGMSK